MNRLPTELWRSIFRLLDYRDIHNRAELVSKAWYFMCWNELESVKLDPYLYENGQELLTNLLYKPVEKLKELKLKDTIFLTEHAFYLMTTLKNLETFHCIDFIFSQDKYQEFDTILSTNLRSIRTLRWTFFQHLTSLKKLENIELYQAQILEETLDCLSHLTSLTSLHINQTFFFHPRYVLLLSEFTSLKRFTLQNPIFFQLPLEFNWWSSLTKLQTLLVSLPSAPSYETTSLKPLSSLLHLEALIFTPGVTLSSPKSESLLPLAALTTLRTLILPLKCSFHELTPLSKLTNLRTLNISSLRMHPELLGYENFSVEVQTPTDMDEMAEVENSNPNIDNESEVKESSLNVQTLECLTTLQQLQEVGLPVGFPTEGFLSLAKLSSLTSLQIDHKPQQPHEWINELSQIVHLKSLSFVLTESLLNVLPHLTNLHTLKLKGTDLPPHQRHFLDLNCLSHLQNLFMTGFEIPIEIALSKHTSLNSLSFTRSQISPSVFQEIGALTSLTHLDLSLSEVDTESDTSFILKSLSALIRLKTLNLTGSYQIPSPPRDFLSVFTNVQSLHCWNTLTNEEVDIIVTTLTTLTAIYVHTTHLEWAFPKLKLLPLCSFCDSLRS